MIVAEHLHRRFRAPAGDVNALDDVSFSLQPGEFVAVKGPSGCGKSTLLLTLGGMQRPSSGRVLLDGHDLYALPPAQRNRLRATRIGFVFQLFHLIPYLDVRHNILAGLPPDTHPRTARQRLDLLLDQLGLGSRAHHLPGGLSAGERQRVALARALVKQPDVILADEPTGNLDPDNAAEVFRQLALFRRSGGTVMVVTHGPDAAPHAQRILQLAAGRLLPDPPPSVPPSPAP
ncbi:MAG: ABC transporter ATP-binding protein [Verrucomicrobiae bacterium]|nr:ABC transporter ATP-binding protein [Verrucomicrobiae bacterium]